MAELPARSRMTSSNFEDSSHEYHESYIVTGGLLSSSSSSNSPGGFLQEFGSSETGNEKAKAALKEREARLDEREAALNKQQEDLAQRENALDAAHERLIGVEEPEKDAADDKSAVVIDELRKENEKLRAELAASKKRSGRFLSQRAEAEEATGNDRFRLSERKSRSTSGGGLPTGFDPQMMERWRLGHQMMTPRRPRPASSRPDGK